LKGVESTDSRNGIFSVAENDVLVVVAVAVFPKETVWFPGFWTLLVFIFCEHPLLVRVPVERKVALIAESSHLDRGSGGRISGD
jgi:hypothetical protein